MPRPHAAPSVALLEPGSGQLVPLRYALKAAQTVSVVARGQWTLRNPAHNTELTVPTVTTPVELTPAGDLVRFRWKGCGLVPAPKGPRDTVTPMLVSALDGSTGEYTLDARGIIGGFKLYAGPSDLALDAGSMQQRSLLGMEMGKGILASTVVPLPEEPVGLGARWQVRRVVVRGPLSFVLLTTYTLEKRAGSQLSLAYRLGGLPYVGTGLRPDELELEVSGGGTATIDLRLPMPTALDDEVQVHARITGRDGNVAEQAGIVGTRLESR
jgi:hypothetical protein